MSSDDQTALWLYMLFIGLLLVVMIFLTDQRLDTIEEALKELRP